MKIGQQIKFIVINRNASSLYSLIADGQYRNTSLGRDTWKSVVGPGSSLQLHCNKEGFNSQCKRHKKAKARIGIVANNGKKCGSCDSRIGFGTAGNPVNSVTCGNYHAADKAGNGEVQIRAIGYVMVQ